MLKTKIAVFVSGGGTNLQALIDAEKRGEIPCGEIALVLASNDSAYALTRANPKRIVNIHPSLIPSFCGKGFYGLHVHEAALGYGVKVTGATVHYVNEIPDGGEIILQKAVEILEGDTPEVLQKRVMEEAEWVLLPKAVEMVACKLQKGN